MLSTLESVWAVCSRSRRKAQLPLRQCIDSRVTPRRACCFRDMALDVRSVVRLSTTIESCQMFTLTSTDKHCQALQVS